MRPPLISVVDDDESVRESLPELLKVLGFASRAFASAEAFLTSDALADTKCLALDLVMPGMSGLELERELKLRKIRIPIIFITAQSNTSIPSDVLARGAVACLSKPFSEDDLRSALSAALGTA